MKTCRINIKLAMEKIQNDFIQRKEYIYEFYRNNIDVEYIFIINMMKNFSDTNKNKEKIRKRLHSFYSIRRNITFTEKFIELFIKFNKKNINTKDLYNKINMEFFKIEHNGKYQNEVSLTTKLVNLIDNHYPIFDARVKGYFSVNKLLLQKSSRVDYHFVEDLEALYSCLKNEKYIMYFQELKNHFHKSKEIRKILPIEKVIDNFLFSMGDDYLKKIEIIKENN